MPSTSSQIERGVVRGGIGEEEHGGAEDIGVLLVGPDVVHTEGLEADAAAHGVTADANLLAIALRRDAHHVALGIDMVLGKLNVPQRAVDGFVVVLQHADAQDDDAGKVAVALDLVQIPAAEDDLIPAAELRM